MRARIDWNWEFDESDGISRLAMPGSLPFTLGPFTIDQSPNVEFRLEELGWIEPERLAGSHADRSYPVSLLFVESNPEVAPGMHPEVRADTLLGRLEALFRLFQRGGIYVRRHGYLWTTDRGEMRPAIFLSRSHVPRGEPATEYELPTYRFDDGTVQRLVPFFADLWPTVINLGSDDPISIALHRFSSAYEQLTLAERITELVLATDALFGDSATDSATYKVALRCASWLRPPGHDREGIFEKIKKLYGDRSALVHGSTLSSKASNEDALQLEEWIREALVMILHRQAEGKPFPKGKQLDRLLFFTG